MRLINTAATLAVPVAAVTCPDSNPGMELFQPGYDLTKMNPLDPTDLGAVNPVLKLTCDLNNSYVNAYNGLTYQLPDQFDGLPTAIASQASDDVSFLLTAGQNFSSALTKISKTSYLWGLFSSSSSYTHTQALRVQEYLDFGVHHSIMLGYKYNLHGAFRADVMNLTDDCQYLLDAAAPIFNETTFGAYEALIGRCGTDLMVSATVGCKFQYTHFSENAKLDTMSDTDVGFNAHLDFLGFVDKSGGISGGGSVATAAYETVTINTTACYGAGSVPCPSSPDSFAKWIAACPAEPTYLSGTFLPLDHIIRDPAKAASFATARVNHFSRAFLKDEVLPLVAVVDALLASPVALKDTGGACTTPAKCPGLTCVNKGGFSQPSCLCNYKDCLNPVTSSTAELNTLVATIKNTTAAARANLAYLKTQAQTLLASNVVSSAATALLGLEFVAILAKAQTALKSSSCSWTEKQYYYYQPYQPDLSGCSSAGVTGKTYPMRTVTYLNA
jgi:hypothetical protein